LPIYMVPEKFVVLHRIPRLEAGKNDKKSLEKLTREMVVTEKVAPSTPNQLILQDIFSDVLLLPKESVGIHDNFFHLGGHSINVLHLLGKIREQFNQDLQVTEIFTMPTIADLSSSIEKSAE